jgi:predicted kinase
MTIAHFVYGSTGAGKTTMSLKLSQENSAVVFSIDEWMKTLYWKDAPEDKVLEWALERVERCENQIWSVSKVLLTKKNPVVFDLGFSKKTQRDKFRKLILDAGFSAQIHYLDVDVQVRKKRVRERNKDLEKGLSIHVSDETFDWMENYFETPTEDELS